MQTSTDTPTTCHFVIDAATNQPSRMFSIFETSATALCGTTGTNGFALPATVLETRRAFYLQLVLQNMILCAVELRLF